jgi:hypothetical protein
MDCPCLKHCLRRGFCKAIDGFSNRKASMTLVAFGMVILVCLIAGKFRPLEANLPTVLGTLVAILGVYITGHAVDQKWSAPPAVVAAVEKKDLPAVAKAIVKEVTKKEEKVEDKEEGS